MSKPVGGRGKKAPYETTHLRIPLPLKSQIEDLIDHYRIFVIDGQIPTSPYLQEARRIVANSRPRDKAIVRRAFAELLSISEDDLKST